MLTDFHTHAFPDKLAAAAVGNLSEKSGGLAYYTDGSVKDLLAKMDDWGVDKAVMLNIATSPKQQANVNDFAISQNGGRLISFGSVHPDSADALEEIEHIHAAGLKGIKFHPEYQGFMIDEERVFPLYRKCRDLGLVMVFHTGRDLGFSGPLRAHPRAVRRVADLFPDAKMVMAHMGGCLMYEEVMAFVAGCGCYIDTSFTAGRMSKEQAENIINRHGADRVVFGSDCPWSTPAETADFINSLELSQADKHKIFYKNAEKLLNL